MLGGDDAIRSLRDALRLSPDNLPLRQLLADTLLNIGRPDEAEREYRQCLSAVPKDGYLKLGLARAFERQGKGQQALVLIEDLLASGDVPPRAYLLHSRLLLSTGDVRYALRQYYRAIEFDPNLTDPDLAARLGIGGSAQSSDSQAGSEVVDGRVREAWDAPPDLREPAAEKPTLAFSDVGGMENLKEEIRMKIIYPLAHADLFRAYGKAIGGGILMYGPPGCGKTYLARATAGEIKAAFVSVGINDILDMWIGNSERNLHDVFDRARASKPCVLFFDEVDALGASRTDMRRSGGRQLINQFLSEMDGVQSSNDGVLILGATNAPWHLDSAFRRPGRFDRVIFVPPPDVAARAAILRLLCRGRPVGDVDFESLAKKTDAFSGADLKALVDVAVEDKLREALKKGTPTPITTRDLASVASSAKPSTKEWLSTARNYALYSNQGGLYDDVVKFLKLGG